MEKIFLLYKIMRSYLIIFKYKLIYGKRFQINLRGKVYFGKNTEIKIGEKASLIIENNFNCRDNNNFNITSGICTIETGVFMNNGNSLNCREEIFIGENTIFGEGIKIYDHDHIFTRGELVKNTGFKASEIKIKENVWIGSNVIILRGSTIGKNSVIGAGTIVKELIEDNMVVYEKKERKYIKMESEKK